MSKSVYNVLEDVANTSSKNDKLVIIGAVVGTPIEYLFKKVVEYAYSPFKMYNIKKFRDKGYSYAGTLQLADSFDVLDRLVARSITGKAAITAVQQTLQNLSEQDASVFARIVKKDLRCGASESSFNKVWPDLVYEHPYMRCSSFSSKNLKKIKAPFLSEVKADGRYVDIIVHAGLRVEYTSRTGHVTDFNDPARDSLLLREAAVHGSFVLMGETLVSDGNGGVLPRAEGNGYLTEDEIDKSLLRFVVWDMVTLEQFLYKKSPTSRIVRLEGVEALIQRLSTSGLSDIDVVAYRICNTPEEAIAHFREVVEAGCEGTVVKNFKGVWKDGTSTDQVKLKIAAEGEVLVTGVNEGEGRLKGSCGSLQCESSCGEVEVNVAGLSDALRKKFFDDPDSIVWKIITVLYNNVVYSETTKKWSLYLPRFVEIRDDKKDSDSKERLQEQLKAAIDLIKFS